MMSRCKMVEFGKSYKNKDQFPYSEEELALYMLDYINFSKDKSLDTNVMYYNPARDNFFSKPHLLNQISNENQDSSV